MIDYERMKNDLMYKANFVWNALSCKSVHGLDGYDNWEDGEGRSAFDDCDNCAYCCGEPKDCDLTDLIHDAAVVVGELRNECDAMQKRLKEQEAVIEQYHKADTFLKAHGWSWEGR